jgi:hypothetical protein
VAIHLATGQDETAGVWGGVIGFAVVSRMLSAGGGAAGN